MNLARSVRSPVTALRSNWPEYLIEGWALGAFMISAGVFSTLLGAPASPLRRLIPDEFLRRALVGVAMGATAAALIYSPWGKRSGAHMNPAVTLTFLRLGKMRTWDAVFYISAQIIGGLLGVLVVAALLHEAFTAAPVRYVVTTPGMRGEAVALLAEITISALLMSVVLRVSNHAVYAKYTGLCAAVLVALFISFEAPLSGMSMNPARSLASAIPARRWGDLWIYFIGPLLGMQAAAAWYVYRRGRKSIGCAKLLHPADQRCIHCGYVPRTQQRNLS